MKLHFAPRSHAVRPRWLLEELEIPYELVRVDAPTQAPVFIDGEVTMTEASAICLYLADRFPEKGFAPPIESAHRAPYLQWLLYAEVTLMPVVLELRTNPQTPRMRLEEVLAVIDARVSGREFIVGNSFTAADLVLASILHLANTLGLLEKHPRLFDYTLRHAKRPAIRRALS